MLTTKASSPSPKQAPASTERLLQVFLSFAGRLEKSQDPIAQDAARRLRSELKGVKISNDNS